VLWPRPNTPTGKRAVRLSKLRALRPAPLLHRPTWGKTSTPDSTHKRACVGVQAMWHAAQEVLLNSGPSCPAGPEGASAEFSVSTSWKFNRSLLKLAESAELFARLDKGAPNPKNAKGDVLA
jgi:hypothetical protein